MSKRPDLIGQVLQGTYRIESLLGEGGMGSVYEASHLRLSQRFAVKVLAPHVAEHPDAVVRFRREAEVTSAIGHPHIVLVIDFNHTGDGEPYIIMEMLEGEDLHSRIRRHIKLDLATAASIFRQTASALQAAHQKGVIHRDLKPKNGFLCKRGEMQDFVKVVDFGISKVLGADSVITQANQLIGTPCYMAPEQAESDASVDLRSDVYSMGVILYEMLAGRPPFTGGPIPALLYQIVHRPPPPLLTFRSDIPHAVATLIDKALAKRPEHRFNSMKRFWRDFADVLANEQVLFYEPTEDRSSNWLQASMDVSRPSNPAEAARWDLTQPLTVNAREAASGDDESIQSIQSIEMVEIVELDRSGSIPPPDGAVGSTLNESMGEVHAPKRRRRSGMLFGLSAAVVLAAGVMAALIGLFGTGSKDPGADPAEGGAVAAASDAERSPSAAVAANKAAAGTPRVKPLPQQHTIRVAAERPATCQALVGANARDLQPTPCRFEGVEDGARFHLVVTAKGYRPFVASWTARANRELTLSLLQRSKRIALAGTPDDAPRTDFRRARTGHVTRRKPGRWTSTKRPRSKKPRKKRIGDGIMGLD